MDPLLPSSSHEPPGSLLHWRPLASLIVTRPEHEDARAAALARTGLLDSAAEASFDRLTALVQRILAVPVALVSLVDRDRQFFKSQQGLAEPWACARETPLSHSFCRHVVASDAPLAISDARDHAALCDNPAIGDLGVVAYLGVPIHTPDGHPIGSLCAIDDTPRAWTDDDQEVLRDLAASVESEIALRMELSEHERAESRYQSLFESSPNAVVLLDPETEVVLDANEAACDLYGYAYQDLVGTSFKSASADPSEGEAVIKTLLAEGGSVRFESVQHRRDGTPVHVAISTSVVQFDGRPVVLSINRDVTEQRKAEAALRESEEQFRLLAETAGDVVVTIDATSQILYVNEACESVFGYTPGEITGQKLSVLMPDHFRGAHRGGTERYAQTGERRLDWRAVEVPGLHRDGHEIPLSISFGEYVRRGERVFTAIIRDVSAQKAVEEALRESESRYRSVVDNVRDVVYQTDRNWRLTFLSPSWETMGYTVEETLGRYFSEVVHPDDLAPLLENDTALLKDLWKHGTTYREELRLVTKGGEVRWFEVHSRFIRDVDGRLLGTTGILADITDSRRFHAEREARQKTEEMLRIKSAFLNNMSHELRTPLTGILGFTEILADEVPNDLRETVEIVHRSAHRLHETLNSVLDLAQLENGDVRLNPQPIDVHDRAGEILTLLGPAAQRKGVRLTLSGGPAVAYVDRAALYRVLTNLVGNAVKFTDAGTVDVELGTGEGTVWARVSDTGIGIPEDVLPHVFEEFRQVSEGYSRSHEGNGLGLTIVQRLVELMHGTVSVESTLGVGTTFTVVLPAMVAAALPAPAPQKLVQEAVS